MTCTGEGSSELVVSIPVAAIRAALRFTSTCTNTNTAFRCIRLHSDGAVLLVDATDSYHLIRLRIDGSWDKCGAEVDALIDFGSRPRIGVKSHDVYAHIAGNHGYLSGQTSKYGDATRTYFGILDKKYPDFGELLPAEDAKYDGAAGISFNAELITDIYKASLDIGASYVTTLGLVHSDKEHKLCPMVFEAEGNDISMRALLMPASRGVIRRANVREGDESQPQPR